MQRKQGGKRLAGKTYKTAENDSLTSAKITESGSYRAVAAEGGAYLASTNKTAVLND